MISNRQINTGFNKGHDAPIILEALQDAKVAGKQYKKGDTLKVTRSTARRFLAVNSKIFHIKMD